MTNYSRFIYKTNYLNAVYFRQHFLFLLIELCHWAQPPEAEPTAPAQNASRYNPPEFSQQFPSGAAESARDTIDKQDDHPKSSDKPAQGRKKRSKPNQNGRTGDGNSGGETFADRDRSKSSPTGLSTDHPSRPDTQGYGGSAEQDESGDAHHDDSYGDDDYGSDQYGYDEHDEETFDDEAYGSNSYGQDAEDADASQSESYPWDEENSWDPWNPGKTNDVASEKGDVSTVDEQTSGDEDVVSGGWTASDEDESREGDSQRIHRVVDGDTLGSLAKRYLGRSDRFLEIFKANSDQLYDPRLLPIGLELVIPNANEAAQTSRSSTMPQDDLSSQRSDAGPDKPSTGGLEPVPTFSIRRRS